MLLREIIFSKVANPGVATFVKIKSFIVVFPDLTKTVETVLLFWKASGWLVLPCYIFMLVTLLH